MAGRRGQLYRYKIFMFGAVIAAGQCASIKVTQNLNQQDSTDIDLKASGSSYSHQYYDWAGSNPGGYNYAITGNGILDNGYDYGSRVDHNNPTRENTYSNYNDINGQNPGYVDQNYNQKAVNHAEYPNYIGGYGGYGGNGGNGGLSSYYGYANPYYQEANHLGYGYYNKKLGFGNIYSGGVTPNLVTGYRGYSRR